MAWHSCLCRAVKGKDVGGVGGGIYLLYRSARRLAPDVWRRAQDGRALLMD